MGKTFDYDTKGKLIITMDDYIDGIIKNVSQIYKEGVGSATPASDHLYQTRDAESENYELLPKAEKKIIIPSRRNVYICQNEVDWTFNSP